VCSFCFSFAADVCCCHSTVTALASPHSVSFCACMQGLCLSLSNFGPPLPHSPSAGACFLRNAGLEHFAQGLPWYHDHDLSPEPISSNDHTTSSLPRPTAEKALSGGAGDVTYGSAKFPVSPVALHYRLQGNKALGPTSLAAPPSTLPSCDTRNVSLSGAAPYYTARSAFCALLAFLQLCCGCLGVSGCLS
jgi:hypothetical protein